MTRSCGLTFTRKRLASMIPAMAKVLLSLEHYCYCGDCEWYGSGEKEVCRVCPSKKLFGKVNKVIEEVKRRLS